MDKTAYGLVQATYHDSDRPCPLGGMRGSTMSASLIVTKPLMETLNYFSHFIYLRKILPVFSQRLTHPKTTRSSWLLPNGGNSIPSHYILNDISILLNVVYRDVDHLDIPLVHFGCS